MPYRRYAPRRGRAKRGTYRRSRRATPARRVYRRRTTTRRSTIERVVRSVVMRQAETKKAIVTYTYNLGGYVQGYSTTNNMMFYNFPIQISPGAGNISTDPIYIQQGINESERIGNKITLTNQTLRIVFTPNPYVAYVNGTSTLANPCNLFPRPGFIIVWIFKFPRGQPTQTAGFAHSLWQGDEGGWFQSGDEDEVGGNGLSGNVIDKVRVTNSNEVRVLYKRVVKIGNSDYPSSFGTNNPANAYQRFTNNDFPMTPSLKIDTTRFHNKRVTFGEQSNEATSERLWLAMEWVPADGTPINASAPSVAASDVNSPFKATITYNTYWKDM